MGAATSTLAAVRDFAAGELGLDTGEHAATPELSLAFPPRTVFTAAEQLTASLNDLGLCPSAALVIKGGYAHLSAADATDGIVEEDAPEVGDTVDTNSEQQAEQRVCPGGHVMAELRNEEEAWCDNCSKGLPA